MKHIALTLTPLEAKALAQMVNVTEFFETRFYETTEDRKLIAAAYRTIRKLDVARREQRMGRTNVSETPDEVRV